MSKKNTAVLDFGSSKITLLVGHRGPNKSFSVMASSEANYAGFMQGEFLEPNLLKDSVAEVLEKIKSKYKTKITKIFIGVPAEFCYNIEKDLTFHLGGRKRIAQNHLIKMFNDADENIVSNSHIIINKAPMYYILDDNNRTNNPIDCFASTIKAHTCFILVENQFIHLINSIMREVGVANYEFLSDVLAQGVYLLNSDTRESGAIFVDCGYITTSVSYFIGDGITDLKSFSAGGGLITSDLSEILNIPFSIAEQVKRKLILTLKPTGLDYYEAYTDSNVQKINAKDANDIALARIDGIVDGIQKCIDSFKEKPADYSPIYLTGGGVSYLKGIAGYLSQQLKRKVVVVKPLLHYNKPDLSSVISLLDTAITMNE